MGPEAWLTLGVVGTVLTVLVAVQRAPDIIMLGGVVALMVLGVLEPGEALAGMANEGMLTVAALFIVAAAVERTGTMALVADRLMGRPRTLLSAQTRVMFPPAIMSAFMNNTPVVAMLVPVIRDWARKNRISVSKLLLPMNYAVVLGGLCTLIGTSTNVVISGLLREQRGEGLGMFEITWLGLPCALIGFAYIMLTSRWLLPERKAVVSEQDDPRAYTIEMMVEADGPLVGRTIEQAGLRHLPGMYLMEIERRGEVLPAVGPTEKLHGDDRLVFVGVVESVVDLQKIRGLRPATDQVFKLDAPRSQRRLIEAVVSNTCPLIGRTIRAGRFRSTYNAAIIAVGRNGERLRGKIGDIVLESGDMLLIEAHPSFIDQQRNSRDFYLVSEVEGSTPPQHHKAWIAGLILVAMVVLAAMEILPILVAAMLAAGLMVVTRCLTATEARRSLEWETLLLIAASFGIARAMQTTGLADSIAEKLIGLGGASPWVTLAMVYLATMLFTEVMSNNASAVLMFPIAWSTAIELDANPMAFVMATAIAASCGFATPMGYQTNIMVFGPGGYRFSDYLRFGGALNLIVATVTITLAPMIWPFQ